MLTVHSIQGNSSEIILHTEARQEMIIVFQMVQTHPILSPALSLILDFNPGSVRPILTHPDFDSSLGFNNDIHGFLGVQVYYFQRQNRKLHLAPRQPFKRSKAESTHDAGSTSKQSACYNVNLGLHPKFAGLSVPETSFQGTKRFPQTIVDFVSTAV